MAQYKYSQMGCDHCNTEICFAGYYLSILYDDDDDEIQPTQAVSCSAKVNFGPTM